jgi:hypothetical protein
VYAPVTPAPEQSSIFENSQMFGDRWKRHVVGPGKIGNASVASRKVCKDLPAGRVSQRSKSPVQRSRRIFNHLVKYLA